MSMMNQHPKLFQLVVTTMSVVVMSLLLTSTAYAQDPPNFVLFVADDMGFSDSGLYGSEIATPNIDSLGTNGVMHTNFHTLPTCSPTRAVLLTGVDNHRNGLGTMCSELEPNQQGQPGYECSLNDRAVTIAQLLKDAGYNTYIAGKWHLGDEAEHLPNARGFTHSFILGPGAASHYNDARGFSRGRDLSDAPMYYEDDMPVSWSQSPFISPALTNTLPSTFYSSAYYTDKMISWIEADKADGKPFFAFLAYTAPHGPLQVPETDNYVQEYLDAGTYDIGWDQLRQNRFNKQKELGIVANHLELPPRWNVNSVNNTPLTAWSDMTESDRLTETKRMAIYAAMIRHMDDDIGRFMQYLKDTGEYTNTVFMFFGDNGADDFDRAYFYENFLGARVQTWMQGFDNSYENMGKRDSFVIMSTGWAQVSSTPFYAAKATVAEGGLRNAFLVSYPGGNLNEGGRTDAFVSVHDIVPTLLDYAGVKHPAGYENAVTGLQEDYHPVNGKSMKQLWMGNTDQIYSDSEPIAFELYGDPKHNAALYLGDWKILRMGIDTWSNKGGEWELFNIAEDPRELNNLGPLYPEQLARMIELYENYEENVGFVPQVAPPEPTLKYALVPQTGQSDCYDETGTARSCTGTGEDGEYQSGAVAPTPRFMKSNGVVTDTMTGLVWLEDADCMLTNYPEYDTFSAAPFVFGTQVEQDGSVSWQMALDFVKGINDGTYANCGAGHTDWRLPNINELRSLNDFGFGYPAVPNTQGTGKWAAGDPFVNVKNEMYWSSTSYEEDPAGTESADNEITTEHAWAVDMATGGFWSDEKTYTNIANLNFNVGIGRVWPVRGSSSTDDPAPVQQTGQTKCYGELGTERNCAGTGEDGEYAMGASWPKPRFSASNGVVTDNLNDLVWLQDFNCIASNYPEYDTFAAESGPTAVLQQPQDGSVSWQMALDFVKGVNDGTYANCGAGHTDWRLPNINELRSLIHFGAGIPAVPNTIGDEGAPLMGGTDPFVNLINSLYWSSTTNQSLPSFYDRAWTIGSRSGASWYVRKTYTDTSTSTLDFGFPAGRVALVRDIGNTQTQPVSSPSYFRSFIDEGVMSGALASALSPDGKFLYLAARDAHALSVYRRDEASGALTYVTAYYDDQNGIDGLHYTSDVQVSPDGNHVYVVGRDDDAVAVFTRNTDTGELTFVTFYQDGVNGVDAMDGASKVEISPDGNHVYVAGGFDNAVAMFSRNSETGELTYFERAIDVDGPFSLKISPDGRHAYVGGGNNAAIYIFNRNASTGMLSIRGVVAQFRDEVDGLVGISSIEFSPDGSSLYVASFGATVFGTTFPGAVAVYNRNAQTGLLTLEQALYDDMGGIDGIGGALSAKVSPDGNLVYATGLSDNALAVLQRGTNGRLTLLKVYKDGVDGVDGLLGARNITISSDGSDVYVLGRDENAIALFRTTSKLPNVVLFVADDMGFSDSGAYGSEIATPHIDSLATNGVKHTNFHTLPSCSPTRASLLTGVDNHRNGLGTMCSELEANQMGQPGYECELNERSVTIAELLKDAGYNTYIAGKWHLGTTAETLPSAKGFEKSFVLGPGAASHYDDARGFSRGRDINGAAMYYENGVAVSWSQSPFISPALTKTLPSDFYSSSYFTDKMIEWVNADRAQGKPFFAFFAYTAPHGPLQVPESDAYVQEYLDAGTYDIGWDQLRQNRLDKQKELGIFSNTLELPPRWVVNSVSGIPLSSWADLSASEKLTETKRMAIYAAMIRHMDDEIGRFMDYLKSIDEYDNTIFMFFGDNGADDFDRAFYYENFLGPRVQQWMAGFDNSYENMGKKNSFVIMSTGWAQVSSTPFYAAKATVAEGGLRNGFLVSYKNGNLAAGSMNDALVSVYDIVPTILDYTGLVHPSGYENAVTGMNEPYYPVNGKTMKQLWEGSVTDVYSETEAVGFELYGDPNHNNALYMGDWKIQRVGIDTWGDQDTPWVLLNLANDPRGLPSSDVKDQYPEQFTMMLNLYNSYVDNVGFVSQTARTYLPIIVNE